MIEFEGRAVDFVPSDEGGVEVAHPFGPIEESGRLDFTTFNEICKRNAGKRKFHGRKRETG